MSKSVKIYLSPSRQRNNLYAVGGTNEMEQCYKIAVACHDSLMRHGIAVKTAAKGIETSTAITESNNYNADIHVCIHTNAHNGTTKGPLIMVYNKDAATMALAQPVYDELFKMSLGRTDYGIRVNTGLTEIVGTRAICLYIECEYHDNPVTAQWIIDNTVELGDAIARGLCTALGVKYAERTSKKYYRVQVGAYTVKNNAKKMLEKLENMGMTGIITYN